MISLKRLFTPLASLDADQVREYIASHPEGTYTLIDVRQPTEYKKEHIPGAKLLPLPQFVDSLSELDPQKPTIVYWASGARSRVAVRLLTGKGFKEVYDLKGGIRAWNGRRASGPRELNMDILSGNESPAEIVIIAYGMEQALGGFYTTMSRRTKDAELKGLFTRLTDIEQKHREMLFALYTEINPSGKNVKKFESHVDAKRMEGGFGIEDFMKQNETSMKTVPDVLAIAMMIETQAIDLYLRFADASIVEHTREILYTIADQEKAHLAVLGRLMEKKV